jgi:hypothetical protein
VCPALRPRIGWRRPSAPASGPIAAAPSPPPGRLEAREPRGCRPGRAIVGAAAPAVRSVPLPRICRPGELRPRRDPRGSWTEVLTVVRGRPAPPPPSRGVASAAPGRAGPAPTAPSRTCGPRPSRGGASTWRGPRRVEPGAGWRLRGAALRRGRSLMAQCVYFGWEMAVSQTALFRPWWVDGIWRAGSGGVLRSPAPGPRVAELGIPRGTSAPQDLPPYCPQTSSHSASPTGRGAAASGEGGSPCPTGKIPTPMKDITAVHAPVPHVPLGARETPGRCPWGTSLALRVGRGRLGLGSLGDFPAQRP